MGALTVASREELDNLIFVINCNLQRLDGPVRGNGKVIQELESAFRGAGWNVIKVIWGEDWDPLLAKDTDGVLVQKMNELVDGELQRYSVSEGSEIREKFFGTDERLKKLVAQYSDEELKRLRRGGHDPAKVYNAFRAAVQRTGRPTAVLAQTIKGYGLGEAGEGRNVTHQQKKLNEEELRHFRSRFGIPISDEQLPEAPFYSFPEGSEELEYLKGRREELGGYLPARQEPDAPLDPPADKIFEDFFHGSEERPVATTMAVVQMLGDLLKDEAVGKHLVPIVPDESRTFGMEALFRQVGIYAHGGQKYEPVDKKSLLYYKEAENGVILEEGITEAGCMSSFIAAGTSHSTYGIPMIPFFIFYSMFGFQRIGDLIWAAGDARARGFMVGGTSGRTTLPGEGLQHADGQSHVLGLSVPNLRAYDPTFAFEVAVILKEGMRRMFMEQEDLIFYLTVMNETYPQPEMPKGVEEGIIKGLYRYRKSEKSGGKGKKGGESGDATAKAHLIGSGAILNEALEAARILEEDYEIPADVWSAPGYKQLYDDGNRVERQNRLNPDEKQKKNYVEECFNEETGVAVAAWDYLKALHLSISLWVPMPFTALGTDGYGRSDNRGALRDYFEVDRRHIVLAALASLAEQKMIDGTVPGKAAKDMDINGDKPNPLDL